MADAAEMRKRDNDYQSTAQDRRWAWVLGILYVVIAVFLALMLFKIWPPTPWPTDKAVENNPQLAKYLADCECPTPTPTASPAPSPSPQTATQASAQPASPSPTVAPSTSPSVTPSRGPGGSQTATGGGAGQANVRAAGTTNSPSPTASPTPVTSTTETLIPIPINFLGFCRRTSFDERLILLVIVAGILGSFVHGATSLADFIGNNKFNRNWTWFYLLRPAIGMALALVFYFVVRGGFLTTSGGARDINPYGIAALAGLVGMFSKQATDKLSEVFSTLFRAAAGEGDAKRSGSLKPDVATGPSITKVTPKSVTAGSTNQTVTVTGTNFTRGCSVFLDTVQQDTTFVSESEVKAKLADANLAVAKKFKLKVVNPDKKESPAVDFTVT